MRQRRSWALGKVSIRFTHRGTSLWASHARLVQASQWWGPQQRWGRQLVETTQLGNIGWNLCQDVGISQLGLL